MNTLVTQPPLNNWEKSDLDNAWERLQALHLVPFNTSQASQFRVFKASCDFSPIIGKGPNPGFNLDFHLVTLSGFIIDHIEYLGSQYQFNPLWSESQKNINWARKVGNEHVTGPYVRYRLLSQWRILQEWKHQAISTSRFGLKPPLAFLSSKISRNRTRTMKAFWRTIMADSITIKGGTTGDGKVDAPAQILSGFKPTADSWYGEMVDIITTDTIPSDVEDFFDKNPGHFRLDDLFQAIELAVARRKFFLSKSGFMGLSPIATCKGDVICIILGGVTPFVLRPASHGRYQLVGECYVHGIMDGESMVDLEKGKYKLQDIMLEWESF